MMMFAVLFGLSMDYEVFLLTAFREHWERAGDMTIAVRRGLADTGRLVTAAALIMVVVFGSFLLSENATVKMFRGGPGNRGGRGRHDRAVPARPGDHGAGAKGTWWLPDWLDRLLPPCTSKATRERSMPPRQGPANDRRAEPRWPSTARRR